jgi:hypothetical protein
MVLERKLFALVHMDDFADILVGPGIPYLVAPRLFDRDGQILGGDIHCDSSGRRFRAQPQDSCRPAGFTERAVRESSAGLQAAEQEKRD